MLAERRLGATVHLLDDGFQHLELARDVDLLLVAEDDLQDQPLPAGRLRERLSAAAAADAALVTAGYDTAAERIGRALGIATVVSRDARRSARRVADRRRRDSVVVPSDSRVFVVTGIARPDRFFADIAVGRLGHRRHDRRSAITTAFTRARRAADRRARRGPPASAIVLTTEKDAVRLAACDLGDLPIASVPLIVGIEPAEAFRALAARSHRGEPRAAAPSTQHPQPHRTRNPHPHRDRDEAPPRVPARPRADRGACA